jgi:hypothetical protein
VSRSVFWLAAAFGVALSSPAAAQVAILQIQIIEGDGAVHAPGSRSAHPLAVQVTDETGKPVGEASVSFHLPDEGPGGTFPNGLRTEIAVTDVRGRAALRGLQVNRVAGRFQVRILASREQARAGTVSFQYIADPASGAASPHRPAPQRAEKGGHGRWALIAAIAGGGAIAGLVAARSGRTPEGAAVPAPASVPAPTVGVPSFTLGKP